MEKGLKVKSVKGVLDTLKTENNQQGFKNSCLSKYWMNPYFNVQFVYS